MFPRPDWPLEVMEGKAFPLENTFLPSGHRFGVGDQSPPDRNGVDELQSIDLDALTEPVAEQQRKLHAKATSEEENYRALL